MAGLLKEFREFVLRGNLVELAVAVVIGVAFAAVIASFVTNLLTPLIAMVVGEPSFAGLSFTINDAEFRYGAFLDELFTFTATAAAVFFVVIKPVNALMGRIGPKEEETKECPHCISSIPATASKCAFCTAPI